MKIIVCIKHVAIPYHPSALDLGAGRFDPDKLVRMLNPYDEVALEAALRLAEATPGGEVIALSVGTAEVEASLRYAAAVGGERVARLIRVDDTAVDPWLTSGQLAEVIRGLSFDLVLCGLKAVDSNGGMVGAFVAERLGLPLVSHVSHIDAPASAGFLVVRRNVGRGDREELDCVLPALLTVELGLNVPRYPRARNRIRAQRVAIEARPAATLAGDPTREVALTRLKGLSAPRPRTRKVPTVNADLSVAERMKAMAASGPSRKKGAGEVVTESPAAAAQRLIKYLSDKGTRH